MVNFLIIGTQKAGTTALDNYLRLHSEIGLPEEKELHFFDNEDFFSKPIVDYSPYEKCFDWNSNKKIYGEATPIYIYWHPSIKRIWDYNKNMKLIMFLRDPAARAFSHWNMEKARGNETENFWDCIVHEKERVKSALPLQHRIFSYVDRGFYSQQIQHILHHFDRKQLHIIKYEWYKMNQEKALTDIFNFLDVDARTYTFEKQLVHNRPYNSSIKKEEREYLVNLFLPDIVKLEKLLQWDCSDWKTV